MITASHLYDHVACPRRVELDLRGDPAARDPVSAFVRLLWEQGAAFEARILAEVGHDAVRLGGLEPAEREALTLEAMAGGAEIVLGGRLRIGDLLGEPDLLLREDGGYVAADVKSGRADDGVGEVEGRPKASYAVQVAHYCHALEELGVSAGRHAYILDPGGRRVRYELSAMRSSRTTESWWRFYGTVRDEVRATAAGAARRGAMSADCGLCHWRTLCKSELTAVGDLSLIPSLGRKLRDAMGDVAGDLAAFAACDAETFVRGRKTVVPGLGSDRLRLFHRRAVLLTTPGAVAHLRGPIDIPKTDVEIMFDIEADPMRDVVYMHGFVERRASAPGVTNFTPCIAATPDAAGERAAFAEAMAYLAARPEATVFYYSPYERTAYRKLQRRYPEVCSADAIEALFSFPRSVDLYLDVVTKATEWPTHNHSIKTLAKFLGFAWRDTDPSGAASIEWYHRWIETGDDAIRQRIADYNEDDCLATAVLLDGIRALPLAPGAALAEGGTASSPDHRDA
ncbi:TM0106 family RecB-like putative nuclease [Polymorphobacter sp. PAMC 29334]|uniref:TM0106 family RecB-like putative nuclease n=1 Tax=Polymorphobacter sp. PAMC 29334 TaxID=2862331 RepID=UPI001C742EF0|nr:TM0106 family RecB-like putative nuclease [Polymorphobacter sp. PAMC 29334]QYE36298.1 TM0106 family RecB-like putative nuclease [Polymorphobacter sp. PAMC 29334]